MLLVLPIQNFYEAFAELIKVDFYASIFDSPGIYFNLRKSVTDGLIIRTQLYSPEIKYNGVTGKNFQLSTNLRLQESQFVNTEPLQFSVKQLKSKQSNIQIESVVGKIQEINLEKIANGLWPECTLATTSAKWQDYQIINSNLTINIINVEN